MSRNPQKNNHLKRRREALENNSQIVLLRFRSPVNRSHSKTYKSKTITIYELKFWEKKLDIQGFPKS